MMLNLVKKDFILAKKYWVVVFLISIVVPTFIESRTNFVSGGFYGFFITVLYNIFMLFNTVSMLEDKYKGTALLCATSYTRSELVKAKYIFVLLIFLCTYIIYMSTTVIVPSLPILNTSALGASFLIISIFFGIIIPLQYKMGYEETKYISMAVVFLSNFVLPVILKFLYSHKINLQIMIPFGKLLPYVVAVIIGFISMTLSIHIFSKKNL